MDKVVTKLRKCTRKEVVSGADGKHHIMEVAYHTLDGTIEDVRAQLNEMPEVRGKERLSEAWFDFDDDQGHDDFNVQLPQSIMVIWVEIGGAQMYATKLDGPPKWYTFREEGEQTIRAGKYFKHYVHGFGDSQSGGGKIISNIFRA